MKARLTMTMLAGVAVIAGPAVAGTQPADAGTGDVEDESPVGLPVDPDAPPAFASHETLAHLADELDELWRERPDLFHAVDEAREAVSAYHRGGAWRPMNVAGMLDRVGDERLLPLLWALAADDPFALGMGLKAWVAWRVGLIESIGRLRDPRGLPLLLSIVGGDAPQAAIHRAAVAAIGRAGEEDAISAAMAVGEAFPERRAAVIEGLGQARRAVAAGYLLEIFGSSADSASRRAAVRALGDWGNLEAWRTPVLAPWSGEGEWGRRAIIEALVDGYPGADPLLRAEIAKTLQLVDVSESAERARRRAELSEDEAQGALWAELEAAMMRSPLRARQERR